jgi:hypothetical protein
VEPVDKRGHYRNDEASAGGRKTMSGRVLILPATAAHKERARGCGGVSSYGNQVYLDKFLGECLSNVRNNRAAEGGAGTALSKTIALASTSFP